MLMSNLATSPHRSTFSFPSGHTSNARYDILQQHKNEWSVRVHLCTALLPSVFPVCPHLATFDAFVCDTQDKAGRQQTSGGLESGCLRPAPVTKQQSSSIGATLCPSASLVIASAHHHLLRLLLQQPVFDGEQVVTSALWLYYW